MNYEYVGNLHIHTLYSDGTGGVPEVVREARLAGLDFIGINDHNNVAAYEAGEYGWMDDVLVIVGSEINMEVNHYLAYGITKPVPENTAKPQKVIDAVSARSGAGFIAHPTDSGSPFILGGEAYPWLDWSVTGYDGIEIWNMLSQWRDATTSLPRFIFYGLVAPGLALWGAPLKALALWDKACGDRKVVAIGGSDSHRIKVGLGCVKFTLDSYWRAFHSINTHVLLSNPLGKTTRSANADTQSIVRALQKGNSFIGLDLIGSTKGFRFWAEGGCVDTPMGGQLEYTPGLSVFKAVAPLSAKRSCMLRLMRNGRAIHSVWGHRLAAGITRPGVYRVECWKRTWPLPPRPWAYSNPIWVDCKTRKP